MSRCVLRHEVEAVHRLGSLGYQAWPSEPRVDEHGRATCTKSLMSPHHAECHDVSIWCIATGWKRTS
eukprot:scaffold33870_cov90-Phaeocystis_antarctica.AAC.1